MNRILAAMLLSASSAALGAELSEIVVTATRLETPQSETATSATVLTRKDLERSQRSQVTDVLREQAGLTVASSGGPGRIATVGIRGADPRHTLVLIDGIEMNDAISTTRTFDFGNLSMQDIERIEIIRGSQSTLYGSDAIGGVIHIITRKGSGPFSGGIGGEYGTYRTFKAQASGGAGSSKFHYYLGAGRQGSEGFPAADRNLGNRLDSGNQQTNVSAKFGGSLTERSSWEAVARFSDAEFDQAGSGGPPGYDAFGNRTGDDPGWRGTSREFYSKVSAKTPPVGLWRSRVALTHSRNRRTSNHEPNALNPSDARYEYESQRLRASWQHDLDVHENDTLTLGLEGFTEEGSSSEFFISSGPDAGIKDKRATAVAAFVQNHFATERFFASGGFRYDAFVEQGSRTTFRAAPGFRFIETGTTLRASAGTGFKVPSLYQRFSAYGDSSLKPETSVSFDAGVEQELSGPALKVGATVFRTQFDELIDYRFAVNRYANVGKAVSRGAELETQWMAARFRTLRASYTYTATRDELTGLALLRRPLHQISLEANESLSDRAEISALGRFVGARDDVDAVSTSRVRMPGYAVFDLRARYRITSSLEAFGRIENLLDRQYQEINGFGTPGRSFFVGARQEI